MVAIIIKSKGISKAQKPKTRSQLEEMLRSDGIGFLSDEDYDKCKWVEKKHGLRKK